jgi:hypothetical protein
VADAPGMPDGVGDVRAAEGEGFTAAGAAPGTGREAWAGAKMARNARSAAEMR